MAQMLVFDPRLTSMSANGDLEALSARLADRLFFGGFKLCSHTERREDGKLHAPRYDLFNFLDQWTLRAATATLIAPNKVLTAGHAVVPADIENTYFIFGRTRHSDIAAPLHPKSNKIKVAARDFARAKRILAWENPRTTRCGRQALLSPDWAIIELEREVSRLRASELALAGPGDPLPPRGIYMLAHPLGLPLKQTTIAEMPGAHLNSRLASGAVTQVHADFASGGSGAPVIHKGKVYGVCHGNARFALGMVRAHPSGERCIDPSIVPPRTRDCAQPVTLIQHIRRTSNI